MTVRVEEVSGYNDDARHVARFMRQSDRDELWALGRTLAHDAIRQSLAVSTEAYIAYDDDEPIAVFGANIPALGSFGVPWLLGTPGVDHRAREYFPWGRRFIEHLLTQCDTLQNMASADNRKTLVFLSRLGFDIGEPFTTPTGSRGVLFRMEAKHV